MLFNTSPDCMLCKTPVQLCTLLMLLLFVILTGSCSNCTADALMKLFLW